MHTHTHARTHTHTHTQIDDYSLVQFQPLDVIDEDSITNLLLYIDNAIQYGEDLEVKVPKVTSVTCMTILEGSSMTHICVIGW